MRNKRIVEVVLAGGLGNQLFQFAAAICSEPDSIVLNAELTKNSLDEYDRPVLAGLVNNKQVKLSNLKPNKIRSKYVNLALRICGQGFPKPLKNILTLSLQLFGYFLFFGYKVYIDRVPNSNSLMGEKVLMMGYFQNPKIFENKKSTILKFLDFSAQRLRLSATDIEIAVHIRGGDYRLEPKLGMLDEKYYERTLNELFTKHSQEKIDVFTNDYIYAKSVLLNIDLRNVTYHLSDEEDFLDSFFLMTLAKKFVMGNSSFAWWAGFLNSNEEPHIYYPKPWFNNVNISPDMGFSDWKSVKSSFA